MTIIHEPICQMPPLPSAQAMIAANQQLREELEQQCAEFLAMGGTTTELPPPVFPRPKKEKPLSVYDEKRKRKKETKIREGINPSSGYLNIRAPHKKSNRWEVQIGPEYIGSYKTLDDAIAARNQARVERKMPKAPR